MALSNWAFDTVHSSVGFNVRHLVVSKVNGRFTKWNGTLKFDPENVTTASVEVQIDVASIDTNDAQRDGHLRTNDFFDAEHHAHITFKSTKVEKIGQSEAKIYGDLTIRGVTKPVALTTELGGVVKDPWGNDRTGFSAKTTIDRKDFGVNFNQVLELGGVAVGEKVEIVLDLEATKIKA